DQAHTIFERNTRRATLLDEARKALEAIEKEAAKDEKSETVHLARAWLFRLYKDAELDTREANKYLTKVLNAEGPEAAPPLPLVKAYQIQRSMTDPDLKATTTERVQLLKKESQTWLRVNRGQRGSPEGVAIRYGLAGAYLAEARDIQQEMQKNPKIAK